MALPFRGEIMCGLKDYLLTNEDADYLSCVGLRDDTSWMDGDLNSKKLSQNYKQLTLIDKVFFGFRIDQSLQTTSVSL